MPIIKLFHFPLRKEIFDLSPLMVITKAPMSVIKEAFRFLGHPITIIVKSPLHQDTPAESEKVQELLVKTGYLTPRMDPKIPELNFLSSIMSGETFSPIPLG